MSTSQCRRLAGRGDLALLCSIAWPPDNKVSAAVAMVYNYGSRRSCWPRRLAI